WHPGAAAYDQDTTEVAFVRRAAPPREGPLDFRIDDPLQPGLERGGVGRRELQIVERDGPGELRPITGEQPSLQSDESHRAIRPHRLPVRHPCIAVEARGDVERENGLLGSVDGANR